MNDLFPPDGFTEARVDQLRTALAVADQLESVKVDILFYREPSPWFCFDIGERKFAIWRRTGEPYECDPDGAVVGDPINIGALQR